MGYFSSVMVLSLHSLTNSLLIDCFFGTLPGPGMPALDEHGELTEGGGGGENEVLVQMLDAQLAYGGEFYGCDVSLALTPLTERCFLTLTQVRPRAPAPPPGAKIATKKIVSQRANACVLKKNSTS